ncbi:hypothetical protein BDV06DRAFT_197049 [Aspergillus oleicola]
MGEREGSERERVRGAQEADHHSCVICLCSRYSGCMPRQLHRALSLSLFVEDAQTRRCLRLETGNWELGTGGICSCSCFYVTICESIVQRQRPGSAENEVTL